MATNFPTSLDSLTNPATSDQLNSPSHALQHTNANDAIEALEAKVGVDGSTVTTSHAYKIAQLESDIQNSAGDFIPLSVLGQPSGPAELDADGNLIVPENKIIIEGATADAHELTIQAPDVTSDITVTLPNAAGTLALTSDITTAVNNLVNSAPNTLDTLNELATALGNDANFATTTATSIGNKVSKAGGDTITSSTASTVPLVLKGAASQTANLQEWKDSAGNLLGRITSTGVTSFYGGSNIFPGDVRAGTSSYLTAALSVASRVATESGLAVRGFASQTANLQEWQNSAGTVLAKVTAAGTLDITPASGDTINFRNSSGSLTLWGGNTRYYMNTELQMTGGNWAAGRLGVDTSGAANVGMVIRGQASQTANLLEFQNSSGVPVTFFNASGGLTATEGVISTAYSGGKMTTGTLGYFNATTFNAAVSPIVVRGAASQTAKLQEWQNSTGAVVASTSVEGNGYFQANLNAASIGAGNNIGGASLTASPWSAVTTVSIIRGYTSQTADLTQWQNSAGTVIARINAAGVIGTTQNVYSSRYYYSSNGTDTGTSISFIDGANGGGLSIRNIDLGTPNAAFDNVVPLTISGNINQTANLQNWKNAAGTVLAKVDSTGAMFTTTAAANTNTTQVATTAYVQTELADLVNSAPATLDTLKELSDALGADANFATTVTNNLALKAPIASPTFTGTVGGITKSMVGLANVDNTTDALKPVSTATQTALDLKANLASPTLTGTPAAPTATTGTNTTQIATTAFVQAEIDASVQPGALYQTTAPTSPEIGQIWIDSDDNVTVFDSNIIRRQPFTATAGQTNFVTTVPFIDGFEQVYFNGLLLLKTTDYTTSGTNTVILGSAAAVNDIIEVVTITNLNSVNTYTQAEINTIVDTQINNLIASAPAALNTLDELAAALGDDASFATTVTTSLGTKKTEVSALISANTNLVAGRRYFVTSASALTLTLPSSPSVNDQIDVFDASGNASAYNITVARNAKLINGNAGNLIIDVNGGWFTLVFTGNTYGWKVA